jgi:hypothetical protein
MATVVMIAAGAGSASGVTALVVKRLRGKRQVDELDQKDRAEAPRTEEKPK